MESTKKNTVKQNNQLSGGLIKHEAIDGREALPIDIESLIYVIREQQVMLDSDLSRLYGVETKVLNQAVKRNIQRFPADFVFQLTKDECLRSQIVTSNGGRGGLRYMPYAFTENGVAMLSSVLRSERAIEVNIRIMRAFTMMRNFVKKHGMLFQRLDRLEMKPGVTLHAYKRAHDRFIIIDEDVYHIGHSLKDLGKKLFAFSKMEVITGSELLSRL